MSGEEKPSGITGRRQAIGLRLVTAFASLLAALAILGPEPIALVAGAAAVAVVAAAPLLRVLWLVIRWWQERDYRFVLIGLALLGVIATGSLIALLVQTPG